MTIGIIANKEKESAPGFSQQICEFLQARGIAIAPEGQKADLWVVLGGDGTMLRAAKNAALLDIPLLGINLGNLGFLTDADKQDGLKSLENVLLGQYESQKRLMLAASIEASLPSPKNLALNEVHVSSDARLQSFSVYVNGVHMDDIRADGVIVATPTGSTAYNLSAGGPILAPYGDMIVITAICPHSLSTRPWVIPASDTVSIVPGGTGLLMLDGEKQAEIPPGSGVEITRAPVSATIIKTTSTHFYEILRRKKIL